MLQAHEIEMVGVSGASGGSQRAQYNFIHHGVRVADLSSSAAMPSAALAFQVCGAHLRIFQLVDVVIFASYFLVNCLALSTSQSR